MESNSLIQMRTGSQMDRITSFSRRCKQTTSQLSDGQSKVKIISITQCKTTNAVIVFIIGLILLQANKSESSRNGEIISREELGFERLDRCGLRPEFDPNSGRMSNGSFARPGQFPSFARLINPTGGFCGATLIGPRLLITAGHCFRKFLLDSDLNFLPGLKVLMGNFDNHEELESFEIEEICVDPEFCFFNGDIGLYDFGLIRLLREVSYGRYIQPACVTLGAEPRRLGPRKNEKLENPGLGAISDSQANNGTLLFLYKSRGCDKLTQNYMESYGRTSECYRTLGHGKACHGDSGGGLFYERHYRGHWRHFVSAVLSMSSMSCDRHNAPELYSKIALAHDRITEMARNLGKCRYRFFEMGFPADCQLVLDVQNPHIHPLDKPDWSSYENVLVGEVSENNSRSHEE